MTSATLASKYVTDTVGLVIRMEHRHLEPLSQTIFEAAEAGIVTIYIPAMVFAEILYLGERKRISITIHDVDSYIRRFPSFVHHPLDIEALLSAAEINDIPDLHDRLIAGTAKRLGLELITNDTKIQASSFVQTVW